jgi:hypothetical protein
VCKYKLGCEHENWIYKPHNRTSVNMVRDLLILCNA